MTRLPDSIIVHECIEQTGIHVSGKADGCPKSEPPFLSLYVDIKYYSHCSALMGTGFASQNRLVVGCLRSHTRNLSKLAS